MQDTSITPYQFVQSHRSLRLAKGKTHFQIQESVKAFEKRHSPVAWRVYVNDMKKIAYMVWVYGSSVDKTRQGHHQGLRAVISEPISSNFSSINKGDVILLKGEPEMHGTWIDCYDSDILMTDEHEELVLNNATIVSLR